MLAVLAMQSAWQIWTQGVPVADTVEQPHW
jgi:hypothetical protein